MIRKIFGHYLLLLASTAFVIGCDVPSENPPTPQINQLKADDDVIFSDESAYGCRFVSMVDEAEGHVARGEYSAAANIIVKEPFCFQSKYLPKQHWTIMQIRGDKAQVGIGNTRQYESLPSPYRFVVEVPYWTELKWLKKASN